MNEQLSIDTFLERSSDESIDKLIEYADISIPNDYIDFIKVMSEVEILVGNERYIRIWGGRWLS